MIKDFVKTEGWLWHDYDVTGSTNDEAAALATEVAAGGYYVISAKEQTAGRGRRGRTWTGGEGNLYMSLLFPFALADCGILTFMLSLALLHTVREYDPQADLALKWPNDVLLQGRKISGILLEKAIGDYIIAGIGVNLKFAPQLSGLLYAAGSLQNFGIEAERKEFLQRFLAKFNHCRQLWQENGGAAVIEQWRALAYGIGGPITVNLPKGQLHGIFSGLDDNGMLLLQTADGTKTISAGDVFFDEEGKR